MAAATSSLQEGTAANWSLRKGKLQRWALEVDLNELTGELRNQVAVYKALARNDAGEEALQGALRGVQETKAKQVTFEGKKGGDKGEAKGQNFAHLFKEGDDDEAEADKVNSQKKRGRRRMGTPEGV